MPLSNTLNELVIRSYQMKIHAMQEGLYNLAMSNEDLHDVVIDWILDVQNMDHALSYFINYERTLNLIISEAQLENAKMKLQIQDLSKMNEELKSKLDNCMESWESQTSK